MAVDEYEHAIRVLQGIPVWEVPWGALPSLGHCQLLQGRVADALATSEKLRANAVVSTKVRNGSLRRVDFAAGQIPPGPVGPQGAPGAPGVSGREEVLAAGDVLVEHRNASAGHDREKLGQQVDAGKMFVGIQAVKDLSGNQRINGRRRVPKDFQRLSRSSRTAWTIASGSMVRPEVSANRTPSLRTSLTTIRRSD